MVRTITALGFFALAGVLMAQERAAFGFTAAEIEAVQNYWREAERYTVEDLNENGQTFAVIQTVEGSVWLHNFYRARANGRVNPTANPAARNQSEAAQDRWIEAKIAYDHGVAAREAARQNGRPAPPVPPNPGNPPAGLTAICGAPPNFAQVCRPQRHTIRFHDGVVITYRTPQPMRRNYAYYRHPEGVMSGGQKVSKLDPATVDRLFQEAGVTPMERRVFEAVSLLEGGFDAVNTYDTGFVSVGFIQFASLSAGSGSLGQTLLRMKTEQPVAFENNFRKMGIDVTPDGVLLVLDIARGDMKMGPDANEQIIQDKRLIASFQRAGRICNEFRIAQIKTAKAMYYPANDPISFTVNGRTFSGKVSDVFKTEAGLATLMDRKVNTGRIGNVNELLANAVREYGFASLAECSQLEWYLTQALTYRENYLANASLAQPQRVETVTSRGTTRRLRGL